MVSEKPHVHNFSALISGAGNGNANSMGAWLFFGFFCWKTPHAHKIPRFRGGDFGFFWKGGWKCQFYFYGHGDFPDGSQM